MGVAPGASSANVFLLLPVSLTALLSSSSPVLCQVLPANKKSNQRELIEKQKLCLPGALLNLILREVVSVIVHVIRVLLSQDGL